MTTCTHVASERSERATHDVTMYIYTRIHVYSIHEYVVYIYEGTRQNGRGAM